MNVARVDLNEEEHRSIQLNFELWYPVHNDIHMINIVTVIYIF